MVQNLCTTTSSRGRLNKFLVQFGNCVNPFFCSRVLPPTANSSHGHSFLIDWRAGKIWFGALAPPCCTNHPIMVQIGSGASTTVKTSNGTQLKRGLRQKKLIYRDLKRASRWLDLWLCGRLWHKIQKQELCNLLLAGPFGGVPVQYCTNTTNALQIVWN